MLPDKAWQHATLGELYHQPGAKVLKSCALEVLRTIRAKWIRECDPQLDAVLGGALAQSPAARTPAAELLQLPFFSAKARQDAVAACEAAAAARQR